MEAALRQKLLNLQLARAAAKRLHEMPQLDRDVFFARLQQETETATAALVEEGLKERGANASA